MPDSPSEPVQIVDFPETRLAVVEHPGDARVFANSIRRFIEWRMQNDLPPTAGDTFHIVREHAGDEPGAGPLRCDLCVATDLEVTDNLYGVIARTIPAGRCAMLRHVGTDATLQAALDTLCTKWLPSSREQRRDFPIFLQRVHFGPEVPAHEVVTHVFLPIKTFRVRTLQAVEIPVVASLLAHALTDDPAYDFLFPDAQQRTQSLRELFTRNLHTHLPYACTYVAIDPSDRQVGTVTLRPLVGSSRVDLQACKLEYSIVSPK